MERIKCKFELISEFQCNKHKSLHDCFIEHLEGISWVNLTLKEKSELLKALKK